MFLLTRNMNNGGEKLTLVKVAETSEIPLGQMKSFKLGEKEVLIANVNGTF